MNQEQSNTFHFLVEYITAKIIGWIQQEQGIGKEDALLQFHNSETFEKLSNPATGFYIESPGFMYEIFKSEQSHGTLRGMTE